MQTENYKEELSERMLSVKQVAYGLSVHPSTVRRWEKNGLLKAYRILARTSDLLETILLISFVKEDRRDL